jgi:predicted  nucleic acid-binding Zn-ribbon protein
MQKLIAIGGLIALLAASAGCNSERAAAELAEANDTLRAAATEQDAVKDRLVKAETTNATATAKIADLSKQLDGANAQIADLSKQLDRGNTQIVESRKAVEALQQKAEDLKSQLASADQSKKAIATTPKGQHDATDEPGAKATANVARTTEQIAAARDFQFEKTTFKTTSAEFKKQYPNSANDHKSKIGESTYEFYSDQIGDIKVTFLDNNIETIMLSYRERQVEELGGPRSIAKRLAAKFGEPESDKDRSAKWFFTSADRFILATTSGNSVGVTVGKISLVAERNERMQKLDAGF